MTENILLIIFTILVLLVIPIMQARRINITSRAEHFVRLALCVLAAIVAHAIFRPHGESFLAFNLAVAANSLILYALTHLLDRFLLRGWAVFQKGRVV